MKHLRRAYNRDSNEPAIIELLTKAGCRVVQLNQPVDLLVGYRTTWVLIEIKSHPAGTKKAALRPGQQKFVDACHAQALPVYVLHSLEDAQAFLAASDRL